MSTNHNSRKRVERLFAEMQQPDFEPANGGRRPVAPPQTEYPPAPFEDVESLRARVRELEARLKELEAKSSSASFVYEKEEIGFAYSGDKVLPVRGDQPPVPDEAKLVKTPLTAGGKAMLKLPGLQNVR